MEYKMSDAIDEELAIMQEREEEETGTINLSSFKLAIKELRNPPALCIDKGESIATAVKMMQEKKIGSLIVCDKDKLCGIVTERDVLMKVTGIINDLQGTKISEVMTADPITLESGDMIAHVMHNMHVGGFRHVPIVDSQGGVQSIVSIKDVLSFIIERFPQEVINVSSVPYRGKASMDGG